MSVKSPSHRDEDFGSKWGKNGNTAKLEAVKWCSDNGYYNTKIDDDGNWYFSATCSGTVPPGWSRRFSNESAAEINPAWNRNDAARADCIRKGFDGIDATQYNAGGWFDYSLKCASITPIGNYNDDGCTGPGVRHMWAKLSVPTGIDWATAANTFAARIKGQKINNLTVINATGRADSTGAYVDVYLQDPSCDVKWSGPVTGLDANGSRITIQKCDNWVNNDPKSCLNSPTSPKPEKWITCALGSSPGGIYPGESASACSPVSSGPTDFPCTLAQNCYAVDSIDVRWSEPVSGRDGDGSNITIQKCDGWVANDPKSCLNSPTSPKPERWISCALGSSPGGIYPGQSAGACSPVSSGPTDFPCMLGQNCYAVNKIDVNWDPPASGCDSAGNNLTIQKCENWVANDPKSCLTSPTAPKALKWISCALGSSPGGIAPGDGATVCGNLSSGPQDFPCAIGQNCFAVTAATPDSNCTPSFFNNPFAFLGKYKWEIIGGLVLLIVLIILGFVIYVKATKSGAIPPPI